jgi:hypothetical protein
LNRLIFRKIMVQMCPLINCNWHCTSLHVSKINFQTWHPSVDFLVPHTHLYRTVQYVHSMTH